MKIITYKFDTDITDTLESHIIDIETELGVHLMKHSVDDTAPIHGHVNISSDGKMEVFLYEDSDVEILNKTDAHLKSHDNYACAGLNKTEAQDTMIALLDIKKA